MAVLGIRGFEQGIVNTGGSSLYNTIANAGGTPVCDSTVFRSGKYSLKCPGVAGTCNVQVTVAAGKRTIGMRYYVRFESLPGGVVGTCLIANPNNNGVVEFNNATGKMRGRIGSNLGNEANVVLTTGVWYRIDVLFDTTASPAKLDFQVNGVAAAQQTQSQTAADMSAVGVGVPTSATGTPYLDDWVWFDTTGEYPLGAGRVIACRPVSDGTHSPSTPDCIQDSTSTLISGGNTAFQYLDDDPWPTPTPSTDLIKQVSSASPHDTHYAEVNLANVPTEMSTIHGVSGVCEVHNVSATTSNNLDVATVGAGAGTTNIFTGSIGSTASLYKAAMITAPGGGWTQATINELVGRIGTSNDASPVPTCSAFMLEVAYLDTALAPPASAVTVAAPSPTFKSVVTVVVAALVIAAASPTLRGKVLPPASAVTVAAPAPSLRDKLLAPAAAVIMAAPTPVFRSQVTPSAASVTTAAPSPVQRGTWVEPASPIAVAAPTPTLGSVVFLATPAGTISVAAPTPILKGRVTSVAAAVVTAAPSPVQRGTLLEPVSPVVVAAPAPALSGSVILDTPAATIAVAAPTPALTSKALPSAASIAVAAPIPSVMTTLTLPAATVATAAPALTFTSRIAAPAAALTVAAPTPDIMTSLVVPSGAVIVTAPAPSATSALATPAAAVVVAAPSPSSSSSIFLVPPAGPIVVAADAPALFTPPNQIQGLYEVKLSSLHSVEVAIPFTDLDFSLVLDAPGTCTVTCALHDPLGLITDATILPGRQILRVYREGVLVFAGPLWDVNADSEQPTITLEAEDWYSYFQRRYLRIHHNLVFDDVDSWDIARAIIAAFMVQYDIGIVPENTDLRGHEITRTWHWWEWSTAAEMLEELATHPSKRFDFWITPDKVWTMRKRRFPEESDVALIQGENIETVSFLRTARNTTTQVFYTGAGDGKDMHAESAKDDVAIDDFSLLMEVRRRAGTLQDHQLDVAADGWIKSSVFTQTQPIIKVKQDTIDFADLGLAKSYLVVYSDGFMELNDFFRLVARQVHYTAAGREEVTLTFDAKTDDLDQEVGS